MEGINKQTNPEPVNTTEEPKTPEKKSTLEQVKEKALKFLKRTRQVATIITIGLIADYQATHNNTIEASNVDGKEVYTHSDKQTTHILNYLGGLDSLSEEEQMHFFKEYIIGWSSQGDSKLTLPENFINFNKQELVKFLSKLDKINDKKQELENEQETLKYFERSLSRYYPKKYEYNDTIYKKLWEVEKECGSPKIDWTFGKNRDFLISNDNKVAHYNSFTHTVFINAQDYKSLGGHFQLRDLVAEWAHAKQFDEHPVGSTLQMIQDGLRIAGDVVTSKEHSFIKSQLKEYNKPGSIEYDAHKIIEPYLEKKFEDIKSLDRAFRRNHKHK